MRKRSVSRELALQMLYQKDITKQSVEDVFDCFYQFRQVNGSISEFANCLVKGTLDNLEKIDQIIKNCVKNWSLNRMSVVDRNILRLTVYSLLYMEDVPPKVSINEAIELAKKFSDYESGKFVNGILDEILKKHIKK